MFAAIGLPLLLAFLPHPASATREPSGYDAQQPLLQHANRSLLLNLSMGLRDGEPPISTLGHISNPSTQKDPPAIFISVNFATAPGTTTPLGFSLVIDTGSGITWIARDDCKTTDSPPEDCEIFHDKKFPKTLAGKADETKWTAEYVGGHYAEGVTVEHGMAFGEDTAFQPQYVGLATRLHEVSAADLSIYGSGVFAMGPPSLLWPALGGKGGYEPVWAQMVRARGLPQTFAIAAAGDYDGFGWLDIGGDLGKQIPTSSTRAVTFKHSSKFQRHWAIDVDFAFAHGDDKDHALPAMVAMVDSGTSGIRVPTAVVDAIHKVIGIKTVEVWGAKRVVVDCGMMEKDAYSIKIYPAGSRERYVTVGSSHWFERDTTVEPDRCLSLIFPYDNDESRDIMILGMPWFWATEKTVFEWHDIEVDEVPPVIIAQQ